MMEMRLAHAGLALYAVGSREVVRFVNQTGRLLAALVRPALWLVIFAAGFRNTLDVSITPPYATAVDYQVYIVPGLVGMVLMFHAMQSSLSMVYDREMGVMRLLLTAPLPRWYLLLCKLMAGTLLAVLQAYVFLGLALAIGIDLPPLGLVTALPAIVAGGLMLGALGLLLSVHIRQLENFAGTMNFVIFPMFFLSGALYPLARLREGGTETIWWIAQANPFTYVVELIRFALYGQLNGTAAAVTVAAMLVFFVAAAHGYDPQRGSLQRAPVTG
jgi:ABC-2 type transport system permease protein